MFFFIALKFFYLSLSRKLKCSAPTARKLGLLNQEILKAYVYLPEPLERIERGTVFFIHGMNKHGALDARIVRIACILSRCGYRVIVPHFEKIASLDTSPSCIDDFILTLQAVLKNKEWCPTHKLAIFTASFASGAVLKAIAHPSVRDSISVCLTVGNWYSGKACFVYALTNNRIDRYAKLIFLMNTLRLRKNYDREIDEALKIAINDTFEKDHSPNLSVYLKALNIDKQNHVIAILANADNTAHYVNEFKEEFERLDNDFNQRGENIRFIRCPVLLIHSAEDTIFPASESRFLHKYFKECGVKSKLLITTLLDHANFKAGLQHFAQLVRLVYLFIYFFKRASS